MADEPRGRSPSSDDHARAVILRRRARFLERSLASTACAAALSCTPARDGANGDTAPVVSVVPEQGSAAPVGSEVPPSTPPPSAPKTAAGPAFEVPAGISDNAKQRYTSLNDAMQDVRNQLDAADAALADCRLDNPDCEKAFVEAATAIHDANRTLRMMYHCPGSSDEAKAYAAYEQAHLAHARARLAATRAAADAAAAGAAQKWQQIQGDIAQARAYPCLSFACKDW